MRQRSVQAVLGAGPAPTESASTPLGWGEGGRADSCGQTGADWCGDVQTVQDGQTSFYGCGAGAGRREGGGGLLTWAPDSLRICTAEELLPGTLYRFGLGRTVGAAFGGGTGATAPRRAIDE